MNDISLYETVPPLKNNFTVKFKTYYKGGELIPHWHEHIELLYFLEGSCTLSAGGESFEVKAGTLVTVGSAQIHFFKAHTPTHYHCILIYPQFFSDINCDEIHIQRVIDGDEYIRSCFDDIESESKKGDTGSDMMLKSHTYRLMSYLVRTYKAPPPTKEDILTRKRELDRINRVVNFISDNYKSKIATRDLAKMCYLTESHFCRFFKRAMGKTLTEYINGFRIEKACVLISKTDEPISSVSAEVGFDDVNYFSRTFKKHRGISPLEYRKSLAAQNNHI